MLGIVAERTGSPLAATAARSIAIYAISSAVVVTAVFLGDAFRDTPVTQEYGALRPLRNFDGGEYREIADAGYTYGGPRERTAIVFFPAYPLLSRALKEALGLPTDVALLIVAHGSLLGAFVFLAAYGAVRRPPAAPAAQWYCLGMFALLPVTFFCRAAYSEALLVFLLALFLYGLNRQWPLVALAVIAGLASATRAVGCAAAVPLVVHAWSRLATDPATPPATIRRAVQTLALGALACWGLLAFMGYQWLEFGDPLAFAKVQFHFGLRRTGHPPMLEEMWSLLILHPIWAVYVPSEIEYWANYDSMLLPFNLQFANPIYFVAAAALVLLGWRRKWLNREELLLSAGLLLIPYVTKSHDSAMASFGRFSAVVLPAYIVAGRLLAALPRPLAIVILAASGFLLVAYAALFAAEYRFI